MEKLLLIVTLLFATSMSFASDPQSSSAQNPQLLQTDLYNEILRMDTLFLTLLTTAI